MMKNISKDKKPDAPKGRGGWSGGPVPDVDNRPVYWLLLLGTLVVGVTCYLMLSKI
jgi:hypothetical protein